ncbi:ArnT family glycosyltransferase [Planctomycetota bacterium]
MEINELNRTGKGVNFWLCGGLLVVLLISIMGREITRPFYGLHSWAQASGSWVSRSHVKYGLGYTKGLSTWAVGDPPTTTPRRYFDHPQLGILLNAGAMAIFGVNEWSGRVVGIASSIITLLLFLRILRGLVDDKTALLAGMMFVVFPLSGYFGFGGWFATFSFLAIYCYLVLIGSLSDGPQPKVWHKVGLAAALFLMLQINWAGFFYGFAIGSHYVFRCIFSKRFPDKSLLAILIVAPLVSFLVTLTIMAGGYDWDVSKIFELFVWRAGKGEYKEVMEKFDWGKWFSVLWGFAVTNFTKPVLITVLLYMTFGQLMVFMPARSEDKEPKKSRRFPQLWLFLIPPVALLLTFRGLVWKHQYWQRPFSPFVAIAAACAVMLLWDILKKLHRQLAVIVTVALVGVFVAFCVIGTNHYFYVRWQPVEKINMFKKLNAMIPADKQLLSFEDFIVNQHSSKGGFIRPEIAWYLDREIVMARKIEDIERQAATGEYPYYLIPRVETLAPLINQLVQKYKVADFISGVNGEQSKDGKFLRAGMVSYIVFDLQRKPQSK